MSLNELLQETNVENVALGREALPDGVHEFRIKAKEDGSSPFKVFVSERSNARGGVIAELGVYLSPVNEEISGEYFRLGLAGVLEGTASKSGKAYQINLGTNTGSVAALLKACGIEGGSVAVADENTGQAIDLSTLDVKVKGGDSVEGTPVAIAINASGELQNVTEEIFASTFQAEIGTRESEYNGQTYKNRTIKFIS